MLEHEVRDVVVVIDHEAVDVSEVMLVRRRDRARAPDLHVTLRDAVVLPHDVVVVGDRRCADGVETLVVGLAEHLLDSYLPVWVLDGEFTEPQVGGLVHSFQLADFRDGAVQYDRPVCFFAGSRPFDGDEPGRVARAVGLHDEMRHAPGRRVDHHIGQLADCAVGATDRAAEVEPHDG